MTIDKYIDKILSFLIKATIFILPLFFLPWTSEYFEFNKQLLLWLAMPLVLFLWLFKAIRAGELKFKDNILNIPILLFLVFSLVSSILSQDRFSSFFGYYGRFSDAWLGLLSLVIFYFLLLNSGVADNKEKIYGLLKLFVYSAMAATAVWFLALAGVFKSLLADQQSVLASYWFNPAGGSLFNFGIFLAAAAASAAALIMSGGLKKIERCMLGAGLVIMLAAIALLNFPLTGAKLPKEAVLSYAPALAAAREEIIARPFFGSGPGMFAYDFSLYRPVWFNSDRLWQIRFDKSASQILEIAGTNGLAALFSYLLVISLAVYLDAKLLLKRLSAARKGSATEGMALTAILSAVFLGLFLCQIFFPANTVLNFIFYLFLGLLTALWRLSEPEIFRERTVDLNADSVYFRISLAALLLFGSAWLVLAGYEIRFFAADIFAASSQNREIGLKTALELNSYRYNYDVSLAKFYLNRAAIETRKAPDKRDESFIRTNVASAVEEAKQAAIKRPDSVAARETLGMVYRDISPMAVGGEPWAIDSFRRALELEPANPILATELAKAYFNNSNLPEAEFYFKKALELKADYYEAEFGLAKTYEKETKDGLALDLLKRLAEKAPDAEVYYELGRYYYNHGQTDKAIERFKLALSFSPQHANSLFSLGIAYEAKGEPAEALKYYQEVLKLNPGSQEVLKKIKSLTK